MSATLLVCGAPCPACSRPPYQQAADFTGLLLHRRAACAGGEGAHPEARRWAQAKGEGHAVMVPRDVFDSLGASGALDSLAKAM